MREQKRRTCKKETGQGRARAVLLRIAAAAAGLLLAASLALLCAPPASALAAQSYTVQGKVKDNTTSDMLHLNTSAGQMEIKIDSTTDTTESRVLLPDQTVTVECYIGNDSYLHATKISNGQRRSAVTVDTTSPVTAQGTAVKGTTEDLIYLSTAGGTMQIKLDDSTDMSECKVLTLGRQLKITCGRGSDGYLHATKVADYTPATSTTINGQTMTLVTGTVGDKTTSSLLKLSTAGGQMDIVLDLITDISQCKVLIPGQSVTVAIYRGADAYMHAAQLVDNTAKTPDAGAVVNPATAVTVTGTVASGTTSQLLYLSTAGGTMQIKFDGNTLMTSGVLMVGRGVKVSCAGGSDGYLHAVSVASN